MLLCSITGKEAADFYEQVPVIIRELLHRLNDDSTVVLKANNKALGALTSCVPAEELVTHLQFIRNLIASMVSEVLAMDISIFQVSACQKVNNPINC